MSECDLTRFRFTEDQRRGVYRAIEERRDVRARFRAAPIPEALLARLLQAAHSGPSVGLMQPWRVIRITSRALRGELHAIVERERKQTGRALAGRSDEFLRLKVEGIRECAELLVVSLMDRREGHIFGRRTLPEMDVASVGCAIENLWLAARAEGVGVGWVSLFDPNQVAELLRMPLGSKPLALLCLGYVDAFDPKPMLEIEGWAQRQALSDVLYENVWGRAMRLCRDHEVPAAEKRSSSRACTQRPAREPDGA